MSNYLEKLSLKFRKVRESGLASSFSKSVGRRRKSNESFLGNIVQIVVLIVLISFSGPVIEKTKHIANFMFFGLGLLIVANITLYFIKKFADSILDKDAYVKSSTLKDVIFKVAIIYILVQYVF